MKYTRGVIEKGEVWGKLPEFEIDKVAVQKEIPTGQLEEGDISEGLRAEIRDELRNIRQRWESSREENARQDKRPLLTSQEWRSIENGTMEGIPLLSWHEWLEKTNGEQWGRLRSLDIFHR